MLFLPAVLVVVVVVVGTSRFVFIGLIADDEDDVVATRGIRVRILPPTPVVVLDEPPPKLTVRWVPRFGILRGGFTGNRGPPPQPLAAARLLLVLVLLLVRRTGRRPASFTAPTAHSNS